MYFSNGKKMTNMLILKILQEHSDRDHLLTQGEIIKRLKNDYGIDCERHAVKTNIIGLKELGYDIKITNKGSYLVEGDFEDAELVMLIDSVIFSKNLSYGQKNV